MLPKNLHARLEERNLDGYQESVWIHPKVDQRKCQNVADVEYVSIRPLWSRHHGGFLTAILHHLDHLSSRSERSRWMWISERTRIDRLTLTAEACRGPVRWKPELPKNAETFMVLVSDQLEMANKLRRRQSEEISSLLHYHIESVLGALQRPKCQVVASWDCA